MSQTKNIKYETCKKCGYNVFDENGDCNKCHSPQFKGTTSPEGASMGRNTKPRGQEGKAEKGSRKESFVTKKTDESIIVPGNLTSKDDGITSQEPFSSSFLVKDKQGYSSLLEIYDYLGDCITGRINEIIDWEKLFIDKSIVERDYITREEADKDRAEYCKDANVIEKQKVKDDFTEILEFIGKLQGQIISNSIPDGNSAITQTAKINTLQLVYDFIKKKELRL